VFSCGQAAYWCLPNGVKSGIGLKPRLFAACWATISLTRAKYSGLIAQRQSGAWKANRVVQKLQFLNNNRLKQQNAEHFAWTCLTTNRVVKQVKSLILAAQDTTSVNHDSQQETEDGPGG
jgi:hypothetical protein